MFQIRAMRDPPIVKLKKTVRNRAGKGDGILSGDAVNYSSSRILGRGSIGSIDRHRAVATRGKHKPGHRFPSRASPTDLPIILVRQESDHSDCRGDAGPTPIHWPMPDRSRRTRPSHQILPQATSRYRPSAAKPGGEVNPRDMTRMKAAQRVKPEQRFVMGDMFLRLRSGDQRQLQFRCCFCHVRFLIRIPRSKSFRSRLYLQRDRTRLSATTGRRAPPSPRARNRSGQLCFQQSRCLRLPAMLKTRLGRRCRC